MKFRYLNESLWLLSYRLVTYFRLFMNKCINTNETIHYINTCKSFLATSSTICIITYINSKYRSNLSLNDPT